MHTPHISPYPSLENIFTHKRLHFYQPYLSIRKIMSSEGSDAHVEQSIYGSIVDPATGEARTTLKPSEVAPPTRVEEAPQQGKHLNIYY